MKIYTVHHFMRFKGFDGGTQHTGTQMRGKTLHSSKLERRDNLQGGLTGGEFWAGGSNSKLEV